ELNPGSRAIHIAILDTGVDQDHEDLASKIVGNIDFTGSGTVDDRNGHGTHVAGIAAAATDNRVGIAGAGAASSLLNVKVLGDEGAGSYSSIANGLVWAADHGAKVINMSLGGRGRSLVLQQAVSYAWTRGAVLVAAAGNDGTGAKNYPAAYSEVIAVAATDANDGKASFSNYGPWVSLGAPGVAIYSTLPNHSNTISSAFGLPLGYASLSGTSMAAPHVAGVAALLWNASSATSNNVVRDRLQRSADPVPGTGVYWRYGRLNAFAAVSSATPAPGPRPGR
ncbi:MAG: S8 family serine peptidase, partial [Chloroflexi bacterium]|nr:S8 family serine peptidase [Chloroflexota bacterium]